MSMIVQVAFAVEVLAAYPDTADIGGSPFSRFFKHVIIGYKGCALYSISLFPEVRRTYLLDDAFKLSGISLLPSLSSADTESHRHCDTRLDTAFVLLCSRATHEEQTAAWALQREFQHAVMDYMQLQQIDYRDAFRCTCGNGIGSSGKRLTADGITVSNHIAQSCQ